MQWGRVVRSRARSFCDDTWQRVGGIGQFRWASVTAVLLAVLLCLTNASTVARPAHPLPTEEASLVAGGATTFYASTISIPTYPYDSFLTTATNSTFNMTYPVLDWTRYLASSPTAVPRTYTLLVLENTYLKVTLLPELGGRVYEIIDKATGHNQLYQNPVIKPTRWGPPEQGWWLAVGGIEWCLPVDEHGYEWGIPWSWAVVSSTAGVTVTLQDTTATNRLRATVEVFLPSDRGHVVLNPRVENPTDAPADFKFWINAALAPGATNAPTEGLSFIFNAPEMSVHSTGDARLPGAYPTMPTAPDYRFSWPQYEGVDYSQLRNWSEWLGFFEYPQATKGYIGVYDGLQGEGMVRVFPPETATGAKAFAMGWSHPLDWHTWTDDASGYVELHGGLAPTFWDTARLAPHSVTSWREVWYPVRDIGTVSVATEEAALRATKDGDLLRLAVKPTRAWSASATELFVWNRTTCTELAHWTMSALDPTSTYQNALTVGTLTPDEIAMAYVDTTHQVLAAYGPSDCLDFTMPAPHVGYGVNVRELSRIPQLVDPLGFEWVKLWDEYGGFPTSVLPQKVLYNVACGAYVNDLNAWRSRIRSAAQAGLGRVQAYEICNEPNVRGSGWGGNTPDPARFAQMVCIARDEIRAIDPHALVISGGLAPVGRIPSPWPCGVGNNCDAMDEWVYLETMLDNGVGTCMDAFGYHPYGFASPPERDPDLVSNAFSFRGVEKLRSILVTRGLAGLPVWATEFNWIRRPADDGRELSCDANPDYLLYFKWQEVSAQTQADYLIRAFRYADTHWPWMQGMIVWNLDWHDYLTWLPCFHSRYYALRRYDGTPLGALTPAYTALAAMDKRPWPHGVPVLSVQPAGLGLISEINDPKVLTRSLTILNTGPGALTWTVSLSPTSTLVPILSPTGGSQGEQLTVTVNTQGLAIGYYTATLRIDAVPTETLGRPKIADVTLHVVTEYRRAYLPTIMRSYVASPPPSAAVPHGPSKIGTHAVSEGGTLELVRRVRDAGGHVALVKGLSFGYLCEVKQISPQTVTIGRWSHSTWEAIAAEGDPAAKASTYMQVHMQQWAPYKSCVDYWEVLNEPDPPTIAGHAWLGEFFKAAMPIAEANGYRLALFSYSMGVPEIYEWQAIAQTGVFAQAKAGGHVLSLHEYGGPLLSDRWGEPMPQYPGQPVDDPTIPLYPDRGVLGGRYRHLYRDILIPRNEVVPLALTEVNLNIWDPATRAPYFLDDIAWYDERLREDDYVLGSAIFTLGGGIAGWGNFDYYEFLPDLAQRIIALKDQ
jgi:hypothetical protein